jgi:hypothetical protein
LLSLIILFEDWNTAALASSSSEAAHEDWAWYKPGRGGSFCRPYGPEATEAMMMWRCHSFFWDRPASRTLCSVLEGTRIRLRLPFLDAKDV